jgi:hypothetical protein
MSAKRDGENQALVRNVNLDIAVLTAHFAGAGQTEWAFFCECGDAGCAEKVPVWR